MYPGNITIHHWTTVNTNNIQISLEEHSIVDHSPSTSWHCRASVLRHYQSTRVECHYRRALWRHRPYRRAIPDYHDGLLYDYRTYLFTIESNPLLGRVLHCLHCCRRTLQIDWYIINQSNHLLKLSFEFLDDLTIINVAFLLCLRLDTFWFSDRLNQTTYKKMNLEKKRRNANL